MPKMKTKSSAKKRLKLLVLVKLKESTRLRVIS